MAHRHGPSHRRNLPPPEHPKTTTTTTTTTITPSPSHHQTLNQDLIQASKSSFLLKPFSSLNLGHKTRVPQKHSQTKHVDTRLQSKSMTTSAILDSSKPNNLKNSSLPSKRTHKEKPQKTSSELEKWKLQGLLKNEKKDPYKNCVVEDVKIEKSNLMKPVKEEHDVIERVSVSMAPSGGGGGGGRRRRSLCGSLIDLGDFFAINGAKMVSADMPPFMQIHAVDCARKTFDSMEKFTSKTLALSLKKEFDGVYGPAWHCIVGTSFGSFVTHSVGGFLYFSMDQKLYILLFKTAVQKAD